MRYSKFLNTRRSVSSNIQVYQTPERVFDTFVFSSSILNEFENRFLTFSIPFDSSWFTDLFDV